MVNGKFSFFLVSCGVLIIFIVINSYTYVFTTKVTKYQRYQIRQIELDGECHCLIYFCSRSDWINIGRIKPVTPIPTIVDTSPSPQTQHGCSFETDTTTPQSVLILPQAQYKHKGFPTVPHPKTPTTNTESAQLLFTPNESIDILTESLQKITLPSTVIKGIDSSHNLVLKNTKFIY